jgi:hypothetical protein
MSSKHALERVLQRSRCPSDLGIPLLGVEPCFGGRLRRAGRIVHRRALTPHLRLDVLEALAGRADRRAARLEELRVPTDRDVDALAHLHGLARGVANIPTDEDRRRDVALVHDEA